MLLLRTLARLGLGALLTAFAGGALLGPRRSFRDRDLAGSFGLAVAVGLSAIVPLVLAWGLLGLPVTAIWIAGIEGTVAAASICLTSNRTDPADIRGVPRWRLSTLVLVGAFGTFLWKVCVVPVWTWDHYLVWGTKARRMVEGGFLDLHFLQSGYFPFANPEYPLGLPLLWRVLALGREPGLVEVKACHVLLGLVVVVLARRALRDAGVSDDWANAVAAAVAVSPLFWDTESMGIADLPLCAIALAALCLLLAWCRNPDARDGWIAGLLIGLLPWIKREGLWLAGLLLAAAAVLARRAIRRRPARSLAILVPAAVVAGSALLVQALCLPHGYDFFAGDWASRVHDRLGEAPGILLAMGGEIVAKEWYGFWILFPGALAYAFYKRRWDVAAAGAVVLGQTALYALTYFATNIDPVQHIQASFFRLMGALLPIAAVAAGLLVGRDLPGAAAQDHSDE